MQQTLMIVDDTRTNRQLLASLLAADDRQIILCADGEEALVQARDQLPDLILLDIVMPGINGLEVCRLLKQDKATEDIPVIFITSLSQTSDEEQGLNLGAVDYITKPFSPAIVSARVRNHLQLCRMAKRLKQMNQELATLATTDPLTGAYNRRFFMEALQTECRRNARYQGSFCLLMMDIDHFKQINDRRGHSVGDMAIKIFYNLIHDGLRDSDILGRLGGDEFAAILTNTNIENASLLAQRLCQRIGQLEIGYIDGSFHMTTSIGVVGFDQASVTVETLLNNADIALYQAKQQGRNCSVVFSAPLAVDKK